MKKLMNMIVLQAMILSLLALSVAGEEIKCEDVTVKETWDVESKSLELLFDGDPYESVIDDALRMISDEFIDEVKAANKKAKNIAQGKCEAQGTFCSLGSLTEKETAVDFEYHFLFEDSAGNTSTEVISASENVKLYDGADASMQGPMSSGLGDIQVRYSGPGHPFLEEYKISKEYTGIYEAKFPCNILF